jgi:integrase
MSKPERRVVVNAKGKEVVYWYARYVGTDGKPVSKSFTGTIHGETAFARCKAHLIAMESAKANGTFIDPSRGKMKLGEYAETVWFTGLVVKPSTHERYEGILRTHVLPKWNSTRLCDIEKEHVQSWVSGMWAEGHGMAAATVRKNHRVLSLILKAAVESGRKFKNPADGINLPPPDESEQRYLNHEELGDLANLCGPEWRLSILFLGYTGLRFGEMAALRLGRLDLKDETLWVRESVTPVKGVMTFGTPKTHASRQVAIPSFLIPELTEQVAGKDINDFVFTGARGAVMRAQTVQRAGLTAAGEAIGKPGFHPHELRHTAASLAIAAGADIKVVQSMMGHKSASMTWDLYGHLFPNRLKEVAEVLDNEARRVGLYKICTKSEILERRAAA